MDRTESAGAFSNPGSIVLFRVQQGSPAGKSFRKTPTKGKLTAYSLLAIVSWLVAIWTYLEGRNTLVGMVPLVVGVICALVGYDTWRRIRQ